MANTYPEVPTFQIDPQSVTNMAVLEELRLLREQVNRLVSMFSDSSEFNTRLAIHNGKLIKQLQKQKEKSQRLTNRLRKLKDHEDVEEKMKQFTQGFAYRKPTK